jgi:L-malate glycosyltransferase
MDSNMKLPKVSVVMPVYNSALYLRESVNSILCQTFTDFELIVADDGSTDGSLHILESFQDERIRIITNQTNIGVVKTLLKAIEQCKGDYIARMDSDDIALPQRLMLEVNILEQKKEVGVVFGFVELIDIYGNTTGVWKEDRDHISDREIKSNLYSTNCLANPTMMMRRELALRYPPNSGFIVSEDWAQWLVMAGDDIVFYKIPEVLLRYRIHPNSETQKATKSGAYSKTIRFKKTYLANRISHSIFKKYELLVFVSLLKDVLYYPWRVLIKPTLSLISKIIKANPIHLLYELFKFKRMLLRSTQNGPFFFFPFHHIGGAEKVHASIVESTSNGQTVVLFTKKSNGDGFLKLFRPYAECIDIWKLCWYPVLRNFTAKLVAKHINQQKNPVVFGCNSVFFYSVLPLLHESVKCIDLIHAFVHPEEDGPEKWSLPVVNKLEKRIFISQRAIADMATLYDKYQIHSDHKKRLVLIKNFADQLITDTIASDSKALRVVYAGRGSAEKRIHLIGEIARQLSNKVIEFTLIGDLQGSVQESYKKYFRFTGEIQDETALAQELAQHHVLLMTSAREGFPMVIMEAMAHRAITISTAVGDIPNVLTEGENGFLIGTQNESEIIFQAVELLTSLSEDRYQLETMRNNAQRFAEEHFSKHKFVIEYQKILQAH